MLDETRLSKILEKKESYQTINDGTDFIRNSNQLNESVSESINPNTYEKKIQPLAANFKINIVSSSPSDNSENERSEPKQANTSNLIDHINLSSSGSANNGKEYLLCFSS